MRNDLQLANEGWRDYLGWLDVGTLWSFKKRGLGGSAKYPGNFVPEIPQNLMMRFTKQGDVVADLFAGSETTADKCAEMGRVYVGCDLRPRSIRTDEGDARTWDPGVKAWLTILHPPYADIIDYNEKLGEREGDLSLPWQAFLDEFRAVAENAHRITEVNGHIALIIGDLYQNKTHIPLAFRAMDVMLGVPGTRLKGIIVKDFGDEVANKGQKKNLWFWRALSGGFFVQEHEYILVFQRIK